MMLNDFQCDKQQRVTVSSSSLWGLFHSHGGVLNSLTPVLVGYTHLGGHCHQPPCHGDPPTNEPANIVAIAIEDLARLLTPWLHGFVQPGLANREPGS